jgi:hypothetical protein
MSKSIPKDWEEFQRRENKEDTARIVQEKQEQAQKQEKKESDKPK